MVSSSQAKQPSLAIVGGGIGGLCLAVALTKRNVPIHVYEAAPVFGEIGAGVGFGPNALRAMKMLDPAIWEGYKRCETTNVSEEEQGRFFIFRYGMETPSSDGMKAGEEICDVRSGCVSSSVHRARFLNELVQLMPEGAASFDKRLVAIDETGEGVLLQFADGTEVRHDAVIGCDGIKSQVRKILLGETHKSSVPVFSGHYCYRGLVPAHKAIEIVGEDLALNSQMYLGKYGHVLTTPIEHGKTLNVVGYRTKRDGQWKDDTWVKQATTEELISKFDDWSESVRKVLSLVENPTVWALFDHLPIKSYHRNGKICLLGDSAHASTPHHGAGAGMAVEDALIMSRLLSAVRTAEDLEAAFATYDEVRRPRSQRLVASSRKIGDVYNLEDSAVGDNMKAMKDYLNNAWKWIWEEDLDLELRTAESRLQEVLKTGQ